jgi:hypothetical protein
MKDSKENSSIAIKEMTQKRLMDQIGNYSIQFSWVEFCFSIPNNGHFHYKSVNFLPFSFWGLDFCKNVEPLYCCSSYDTYFWKRMNEAKVSSNDVTLVPPFVELYEIFWIHHTSSRDSLLYQTSFTSSFLILFWRPKHFNLFSCNFLLLFHWKNCNEYLSCG